MRAEIVIASVIAVSGLLAAGQAIHRGLQDPPPPPAVADPASTRCAGHYEAVEGGTRRMTIAVVGDRVTAWQPPDERATSWASYAAGHGVRIVDFWAERDARVRDLTAVVTPSDADVLVILAGTNDLDHAASADEVELGMQRIAETAGTDDVLVSSIPPVEGQPQKTADFNELLARIAYRHDWSFVDAGSTVVAKNCTYRKDMSDDGIRPTAEGARLIGEAVRGVLTTRPALAPTG